MNFLLAVILSVPSCRGSRFRSSLGDVIRFISTAVCIQSNSCIGAFVGATLQRVSVCTQTQTNVKCFRDIAKNSNSTKMNTIMLHTQFMTQTVGQHHPPAAPKRDTVCLVHICLLAQESFVWPHHVGNIDKIQIHRLVMPKKRTLGTQNHHGGHTSNINTPNKDVCAFHGTVPVPCHQISKRKSCVTVQYSYSPREFNQTTTKRTTQSRHLPIELIRSQSISQHSVLRGA